MQHPHAFGVDGLKAVLRRPSAWPEHLAADADGVEVVFTHLSVVVLVGAEVFKIKRPVDLPFCDLTDPARRLELCEDEVAINARLAPETYRGVVWVHAGSGDRDLNFAGRGERLEPAVHMGRLPQDRMLDEELGRGAVSERAMDGLGELLGRFHGGLVRAGDGHRGEVREAADPARLREFAAANFEELRDALPGAGGEGGHPAWRAATSAYADVLEARCRRDFDAHGPLLQQRADAPGSGRRIVEGHGDLHARNICMTSPPTVYDALEFDLGLRALDLSVELAFLTMDLRYRGHGELVGPFVRAWERAFADGDPPLVDDGLRTLLPMMERYRALVRGKISALLLGDEEVAEEQRRHAVESLLGHLRLAAATAVEERPEPRWIVVCGVPATGKSTVCSELVAASGGTWDWLSTDRIRKQLAGLDDPTERLDDRFYRRDFSDATYAEVSERAGASPAPVVLIDGNYVRAARRDALRDDARAAGAAVAFVWLDLDEDEAVRRLEARADDPGSESDAGVEVWKQVRAAAEPPSEGEATRFDAAEQRGAAGLVDRVLARLAADAG